LKLTSDGYPNPETSPDDYDWFCRRLECFAVEINGPNRNEWTGEKVECAFFDRAGGEWRKHIGLSFKNPKNAQRKFSKNMMISADEIERKYQESLNKK
jgi:hypothetical protein